MAPSIKKCTKCGFELPIDSSRYACPICKEVFREGICHMCGKYSFGENYYPTHKRCKECNRKYRREVYYKDRKRYIKMHQECDRKRYKKLREQADEIYNKMLATASQLQHTHTLTEKEWINACKYFGGCALCPSTDIDIRYFFMPFRAGGRYCAWNIIPVCERCGRTRFKRAFQPNILISMQPQLNPGSKRIYKEDKWEERIKKLEDYIQTRLEEALRETME